MFKIKVILKTQCFLVILLLCSWAETNIMVCYWASLLSFAFSDVTFVPWNQLWWEDLHQGNRQILVPALPPQSGLLHITSTHWLSWYTHAHQPGMTGKSSLLRFSITYSHKTPQAIIPQIFTECLPCAKTLGKWWAKSTESFPRGDYSLAELDSK